MDPDEFRRRQDARILAHDHLARLQRDAEVRAVAFWDPNEEIAGTAWSSFSDALNAAICADTSDIGGRRVTPYVPGAYADYLRSPHWLAVRQHMLGRAGCVCSRCHRHNQMLDVHHLDYRHLGAERERDLIVLCRDCHQAEHRREF
jgi:hypothetical protein